MARLSTSAPDRELADQTRGALALLGFHSAHETEWRVRNMPWFDYGWFETEPPLPYSIWVCCFPNEHFEATLAIDVKLMAKYRAYPDEPPQGRSRFIVAPGVTDHVIDAVQKFNDKMRMMRCAQRMR